MKSNQRQIVIVLFCLMLLAALLSGCTSGKSPQEQWNRTFGGQYSDGAWSLQTTNDGGYIIAGYTASRGEGSDLWLIKADSKGNHIWDKAFGGSGEDTAYFVQETKDGGYIAAGSTKSYGIGDERLWLLKTDSNGSLKWDRTFGGFVSSSGEGGWSLAETKDGGYIVAGYTKSYGAGGKDLWLIRTDHLGNRLWDKVFGGAKDDVGMSVVQTKDGGYFITGRTASYGAGEDDVWLLKTGPQGILQWNVTIGGKKDDVGFQAIELADGYAIVGRTESGNPQAKMTFLLKTDLRGRKIWEREYERESSGISLKSTSDGGFIIAGSIDSEQRGRDALLIKTDSIGLEQWSIPLGGPGDDIGTSVVEVNQGEFVLAGITNSMGSGAEDAWLASLKADKNLSEVNAASGNDAKSGDDATSGNSATRAKANSAAALAKDVANTTSNGSTNNERPASGVDRNSYQAMLDFEKIFKQRR
jgi:hypothetical protein